MKTLILKKHSLKTLFLTSLFFLLTMVANAQSATATYSEGLATAPTVSNTDLLQTNATLTASSGSFTNEGSAGVAVLKDGTAAPLSNSGRAGIGSSSSLTYTFSASPTGADVTGIDIISTWNDNGRLTPNVTVYYSLKATPETFVALTGATTVFTPTLGAGGGGVWVKSSFAITGLTGIAALRFDFGVQQNGFVGYSEIDVFGNANIVDTEAPSVPMNLTNGIIESTSVVLNWDASTDNAAVTGYDIYVDGVYKGSSIINSYTVTDLNPSTQYSFTVKAKDAVPNISAASTPLVVTTLANLAVKTYSEGFGTPAIVSNTDLLQTNSTLEATGSFSGESSGGTASLTNGDALFGASNRAGIGSGASLTYSFTGWAAGYDLTGIDIYTTWQNNGRLTPNVVVSYSVVESPTVFLPLTTVTYNPIKEFDEAGIWTKSSIAITDINAVAAVRFDFPSQQNGFVGYNEIDVFGSPKVSTALKNIDVNTKVYFQNGAILADLTALKGVSTVSVIDAKGSVIKTIQSTAAEMLTINVANKGLYLVRVQNAGKVSIVKVAL